jgi:hypothetical protein
MLSYLCVGKYVIAVSASRANICSQLFSIKQSNKFNLSDHISLN